MTRTTDGNINWDNYVSKLDFGTQLGQILALGGSARGSDHKRARPPLYFPIDTITANMAASARPIATQRRIDVAFDAIEFKASPPHGEKNLVMTNI